MKLSLLGKLPICIFIILVSLFSTQLLANGIEIDTSSQRSSLLAPLPIKTLDFVESNKFKIKSMVPQTESAVNFSIANPSKDQIDDWLEGDYSNLNQVFSGGGPKLKAAMIDSALVFVGKARSVLDSAIAVGNFVTQFTGKDLKSLPVAMKKKLDDNTEVVIGIGNIYLFPAYASLEIFVRVTAPNLQDPIYLAAPDVKFSRLGGISGVVSLGLLGDFTLPVLEEKATIRLKSAMVDEEKNEFKTGMGTYAEFSCDGLETISIDANLAISRDIILPADEDPEKPDTNNLVNGNFFTATSNGLSDIISEISFDQPFYHVQNDKLIWTINSAVFDFSTLDHRQSLEFPVGNYDPTETLAHIDNWQGVYIKEISVEWRDSIAQVEGQEPKSFSISGTEIIIDEAGFTGQITAENIIPLSDNRQINKWAFSIDYLSVSILTNTFESLDFAGHLGMPMTYPDDAPPTDTTQLINYAGSFDFVEKRYLISGNLPTDKVLPLKMFKGQIRIENTSVFTIGYENKKIFLAANLNVDFETKEESENAGEDDKNLAVPLVEVTGLNISSKSPFLLATGNWILRDTISVASFAGFGLNINLLKVEKNPQTMDPELIVGADINLAAGDNVHISGATVVRVTANIEDTPTSQKWKFKEVNLEMIKVEADVGAFKIDGQVVFFKNLDSESANGQLGYGSGFQGDVSLKIKGFNKKDDGSGTGIKAMALFGTTTNSENQKFRYFMVDVLAYFDNGIPIGPIALHGIGGGVYYRMKQEDLSSNFTNVPEFSPPNPAVVSNYTTYISSFIGRNLSGAKYRPDPSVFLGININVILGAIPRPQAFNTNIGVSMEINDNGGLNFIKLNGIMNAMTDISPEGPACSGVSLAIEMEFVFETSSERSHKGFYASAHAFVKVGPLGGNNSNPPARFKSYVDRCSDDLGYAGGLEMQFSKDYWFLNVGEPESRLGLEIDLWKLGSINLETYFDIGKNIPAFPGLPAEVRSLTRMSNLLQNETTRTAGTGFAFGVSFAANLDTPRFLGFSAHLSFGAGFDIMLNKFKDVNCLNSGSPKPIGVKNWYAAGQAWLYIDGSIKFMGNEVLGLGLAAAIQIKGPNPTFGRGALAGRVRVGPFKKKFNVHFQFGKECEVQGSQELEQEIEIVLFMTPSNDDQSIDVSTEVDVVFAQELNENFAVTNPNTSENEYYTIEMESFEITDPDGNEINFNQEQISGQFFRYRPIDQLKSYTEYTLTLIAKLFKENGELVETEERIHIFKTGEFPSEIYNENIDFALPGNGQFNLYKFDNSSQYIQLLQGQEELLADLPEGNSLKAKISTTHPSSVNYKNCSYNSEMNRLNFSIASGLTNGKSYKLEIVKVVDDQFSEFENSEDFDLDEFSLPAPFENETVLHTMAFRVSNYNRFEDKIIAAAFSNLQLTHPDSPRFTHEYGKPHSVEINNLSEPFGIEEVEGIYENDPSIIFEANLNSTSWITNNFRKFSRQETSNMDIYGFSDGERMTDYLDTDRVTYFDNREPAKGIFLLQDSIYQSKVENIHTFNNNLDLSNIKIEIDYALGMIMYQELNSVFAYLKETELGPFEMIDIQEYSEFQGSSENCGLNNITLEQLKECCKTDDFVYDALVNYTGYKLTAMSPTLRKFIYAPEEQNAFCRWNQNLFTKRNLYTDIKPGSYPIMIRYYKPTSSTPHQTFNQTFIKN